jgi:hypothetical protein
LSTLVLTCPRCGGTRRVVAVVLRSATAQAILGRERLHGEVKRRIRPVGTFQGPVLVLSESSALTGRVAKVLAQLGGCTRAQTVAMLVR